MRSPSRRQPSIVLGQASRNARADSWSSSFVTFRWPGSGRYSAAGPLCFGFRLRRIAFATISSSSAPRPMPSRVASETIASSVAGATRAASITRAASPIFGRPFGLFVRPLGSGAIFCIVYQ